MAPSKCPIVQSTPSAINGSFQLIPATTIKELPIKRGTVVTKWILPSAREEMYRIIEKELVKGRQAYFICPRVDGEEDMAGVANEYANIARIFNKYSCASLTGKDTNEIKTRTLQYFKSGKYKILVSTIIAEVGLDVPNATIMVIEGADRFGLSQLHQLRGRVSRSTETAICFLVAETANETSIARLRTLEQTNDGFEIAEADLRLRGPGEMFSTRQHGLPDLKFASLIDDYDLLLKARDLAKILVDKLDQPGYNGLREMLRIKYPNLNCIGVA